MKDIAALITCDPEFVECALRELLELFPDADIRHPQQGAVGAGEVLRVSAGLPYHRFAEEVLRTHPIFIRHLAPVQAEAALEGSENDLARLLELAPEIAQRLVPSRSFAVQTRLLMAGAHPFRTVALNEQLSSTLSQITGCALNVKDPQQIVSVACFVDAALVGVSRAELNLSNWPGGAHRFKAEEGQVSRSEFKLREAIEAFKLKIGAGGLALDMGAAPGGWSRVLAEYGLNVVAVDPADLDPRVLANPRVKHVRQRIQEYLGHAPRFRIIVNDMKMDPPESVEAMLRATDRIEPGGLGIMTIKIARPETGSTTALDLVRACLANLEQRYRVIGARQFYHNRSEVTVALRAA